MAGQTCFFTSPPEQNGLYNRSKVNILCQQPDHDHCSSAPCGNHGNCTSTLNSYTCNCHHGYTGVDCTAVDHCSLDPCSSENSIGCVNLDQENSFFCRCADGWGGNLCNQDIDECGSGEPCNGGRCVNVLGGYMCQDCPLNRTGDNCDVLLTCDNMPCHNGGSCIENGGVANCSCTTGYTGLHCETESE